MHALHKEKLVSTFHVKEILKKRPELVGILGKKKIGHLHHAVVELIDFEFLDRLAYGGYFLVSHDGTLLGEAGVYPRRTFLDSFLRGLLGKTETVLDAVTRIGAERIAYIAVRRSVLGCCESDEPCHLFIHKPAGGMRLDEHIRALTQRAKSQLNV